MALNIIGLGLWDEYDITLKGLELVKKSAFVYLEYYTSRLSVPVERLEKLYGKKIIVADRELVEIKSDEILVRADESDVSFLVIGDPFCATTHTDLRMRAIDKGIKVRLVNNASIINSVGVCGIDMYKFGRITSIPFLNDHVTSVLDVIRANLDMGLSTLVLLDLDPPNEKYMRIKDAISYLKRVGLEDRKLIGCAGIGSPDVQIVYGSFYELENFDFRLLPQCLIIPGKLHFVEKEMLEKFSL